MRTVLLGDSHLARVRRDLRRISAGEIVNAAVGGAIASELLPQARGVPVTGGDTVVVSIGTNDVASWRAVPLDTYAGELRRFLHEIRPARLVLVAPPGIVESRGGAAGFRTSAPVTEYADVAAMLFRGAGGLVLDSARLLAPLGADAFAEDGLHLTGAGYDALLPAIAAAVA